MDDFKSYINAIDVDYESGDVTFTGFVYILNTPQFNVAKRNAYAKGTNCVQKLLKIMDKNVIFLRVFAALQNVKNILLKKIIQKIFYLSLEMKNIDRE